MLSVADFVQTPPHSLFQIAQYSVEHAKLEALQVEREQAISEVARLEIKLRDVSQAKHDIIQRRAEALVAGKSAWEDPVQSLTAVRERLEVIGAAIVLQREILLEAATSASQTVCEAQRKRYGDVVKRLASAAREICDVAREEAAFRLRLRDGKVNTSLGLDQVPFDQIDHIEQWLVMAENAGHLDEAENILTLE